MPIKVPSTTAKTAAGTAARTVLINPARKARQNGWLASKSSQPSLMEKPAGSVRKSNPDRTPRERSTSSAWFITQTAPASTASTSSAWTIQASQAPRREACRLIEPVVRRSGRPCSRDCSIRAAA